MLTINQFKQLRKSEVPNLEEEEDPQQAHQSVFEHIPDHTRTLSEIARSWMNDPANHVARAALANDAHVLSQEQREKMLQQLARHTNVRVNPKNQNREFLLHRGVSTEEKNNSVQDGTVYHPTASSWTPSYHVAHGFGAENLSNERALEDGDRSNIINESHNNVLSAWIPEKHIATMPSIHLTSQQKKENPYLDEHEVIVKPHHVSKLAEDKDRPAAMMAKHSAMVLKKSDKSPVQFETKPEQQATVVNSDVNQTKPALAPTVKTPPNNPVVTKIKAEFKERRQEAANRKRENMNTAPNPSPTALAVDKNSQSGGEIPDAICSAIRSTGTPEFTKKMKNGLVYGVINSPDKTKTYHFLTSPSDEYDAPQVLSAVELSHSPEGSTITSSFNRRSGEHNFPALLKYAMKYHNVDKLLVQELDPEKHGIPQFKGHNPEVITGLRYNINNRRLSGGTASAQLLSNREGTKKAIAKKPIPFDVIDNSVTGGRFEDQVYAQFNSHWKDPEFNTSHREAAYDRLARNFFGMGEFVPKTTAYKDPVSGEIHSAQEWKEGASSGNNSEYSADISNNNKKPDLQKMGLMDLILGNTDRHGGNMMFDKNGKVILIDHGLSFDIPNSPVVDQTHYVGNNPIPKMIRDKTGVLSPETKSWLESLDPKRMAEELQESKVPPELADRVVNRLEQLKSEVFSKPNADISYFIGKLLRTGTRKKS